MFGTEFRADDGVELPQIKADLPGRCMRVSNVTGNEPEYAVPGPARVPVSDYPAQMAPIPPSRMFIVKNSLNAFRERFPERETFNASQGDGGASLPGVPAELLEAAHRMQVDHGTAYDLPGGCAEFRRAVVEDYWQATTDTRLTPDNVLDGAGGRDVLVKAFAAMLSLGAGRVGDVVVTSRVPWISYNWGPYGVGANVMHAPGDAADGWAHTPDGIQACVNLAAREGREVAGVVITSPDNPTGRTLSTDEQVALGKAALRAGVRFVLYDWIYHWVTDDAPTDINAFLPQFDVDERRRIMIMDGITKSLGGSNIRNAHLIAPTEVVRFIQNRASHGVIPSFHSQAVAIAAFRAGMAKAAAGIIEPTRQSRQLVREFVAHRDMNAIIGQGYYALIDVTRWLRAAGMADSEALGAHLAENHGVAVVPGVFFSKHGKDWVRFSYAMPPDHTKGALERLWEGLCALES